MHKVVKVKMNGKHRFLTKEAFNLAYGSCKENKTDTLFKIREFDVLNVMDLEKILEDSE